MSAAAKDISDLHAQFGSQGMCDLIENSIRPITVTKLKQAAPSDAKPKRLPPITGAVDFLRTEISEPPEIIHGVLHQGCKMILSGGSKTYKTWGMMDLAASVAAGIPWWGFPCTQGRVLYVNMELMSVFFRKRLLGIQLEKEIPISRLANLSVWNLKGHTSDISEIVEDMIQEIGKGYSLVILDPIYKLLGDRDENSNGEIADLMNEIERIARDCNTAVVFGHHFSKGNQANRDPMDRMSGAGAFARDADSLLSITKHEEEHTFTVDATLRNHPYIEPFCITWQHPLMRKNTSLDPKKIKKANGRAKSHTVSDVVNLLGDNEEITRAELKVKALKKMGDGTFNDRYRDAIASGYLVKTQDGKKIKRGSPMLPIGWNSIEAKQDGADSAGSAN